MRIFQLIPGTGHFYCGSCLRDNALGHALRRRGHNVRMVPLYLPFMLEEQEREPQRAPVYLGGINMYLQYKWAPAARLPGWLRRMLDAPGLLRWVAARSNMTGAAELGDLTISTLRGLEGRQASEVRRLIEALRAEPRPDCIILSNALLCGLAEALASEFRCPILCTLQGEAPFLDSLPATHREEAWRVLRECAQRISHFIAVSRYCGDLMIERLDLPRERVHVVLNGIDLGDFAPRAERRIDEPRTIGYLARLCRDKGLATLVEAFILLRKRAGFADVRLRAAGAMLRGDAAFVEGLRSRLREAGLAEAAQFTPNIERPAKIELLRSLDLLSVPATYGESFGLYLIEAMACGVPVVQPRHGAFPELIQATGGGVLCEPDDPASLAEALAALLGDRERARALGQAGRANVIERFSDDRMAREIEEVCMMVTRPAAARAPSPLTV